MPSERLARIKEVFSGAVELPGGDRTRFLHAECGNDVELLAEVRALLAADTRAGTGVLERPLYAPGADTRVIGENDSAPVKAEPLPRIGGYRLIRKIGEGGMGTVYEAEQEHPRRRVAVKVIRADVASPALIRRFVREAELLGQLQHPGIARIYEAGTQQLESGATVPYFAMELVNGEPLDRYVRSRNLSSGARLELIALLCDAVHHAHQRGVIHRDLKPGNILVSDNAGATDNPDLQQTPRILDFGVARIIAADNSATLGTEVGQIIGTLGYMSPEQVSGEPGRADARSDVYALGVILYETVAERSPYDVRERSLAEAARIIQETEPTRLSFVDQRFRGDIEKIAAKALEKDPDRRYASAAELGADIRRFLHDEPIHARPSSAMYQLRKFARRNKGLVTGLAVAGICLIVGIVVSGALAVAEGWQRKRAEANAAEASKQARRAAAGEKEARQSAYRACIAAAAGAVQAGDVTAARVNLAAAPAEYRGWEWRYYSRLSDRSLFTLRAGKTRPLMSLSGDGNWLATGAAEPRVQIWSIASGEPKAQIEVPEASSDFALAPRGDRVLWSDGRTRTQLIDAATSAVVWELALGLRISADAFSPDETVFAAGQVGGAPPALFDVRTGGQIAALADPSAIPAVVSFSPNGRWIVLQYAHGRNIVLDALSREPTLSFDSWQFAITPDSESISTFTVIGPTCDLLLTDIRTGEVRQMTTYPGPPPRTWAFRPGAPELALADSSGNIEILEASSLRRRARIFGQAQIASLAYSRDGTRLLSAGADGSVRVWDAAITAAPLTVDAPPYELGYGAAISSDGQRTARVGWGSVSVWNAQTGAICWRRFVSRTFYHAIAFRPDGAALAIGGQDGRITLLDAGTGQTLREIPVPGAALIFSIGWLQNGAALIATLDTGEIRRIDLSRDAQMRVAQHDSPATCCAVSPDGAWIATGSGNGLPGGDFGAMATATNDRTIRLQRADGAELLRLNGHTQAVTALAFSSDGALLASGSLDQTALLWNARTGERILTLETALAPVSGLAFSPDGTRIAAACGDSVRVWESTTGQLLASLPCGANAGVLAVAFTPASDGLVASCTTIPLVVFETQSPACGEPARELSARARTELEAARQGDELTDDLIGRIARDANLPDALRQEMLRQARAIGDPASRFASDATLTSALKPDAGTAFATALRKVDSAQRSLPDDWRLLPTRGLLEYRTGDIESARATLRQAEIRYAENNTPPPVSLLLALCLVEAHAAETEAARERLCSVYEQWPQLGDVLRARYAALLHEAEELLHSQ